MDASAGIEAEYYHKNNRVYCWKGLRFSARQDLEGFSRFNELGIEGVVPPELLPPEVRSKYHTKPSERSKRAKKDEAKDATPQPVDNQTTTTVTEIDGGGISGELEDSAVPVDADTVGVNISQSGALTPEDNSELSPNAESGEEAGQSEAEAEVEAEAGTIDGETDPEGDADAAS